MTGPAIARVAVVVAAMAGSAVLCVWLGEAICRHVAGFRPWRRRVPEVAFLMGYAALGLGGYAALVLSESAKWIIVAALLIGLAFRLYGRVGEEELPEFLEHYIQFRNHRAGWLGVGLIVVFSGLVTAVRMPWLLEMEGFQSVVAGTVIYDDVRTVGFPISLAAHGYPLRSPIAAEMVLAYPLGAFIAAAGWIAWIPAQALPILLGDVFLQALFYGLALAITACASVRTNVGRLMVMTIGLIGFSLNWWYLGLSKEAQWVNYFFGYFRLNQQYSTIGWTPVGGMLWIANHAIGFGASLLAATFMGKGPWRMAIPFAAFCAAASIDMATMGLAAAGLVLAWEWVKQRDETALWRGVIVCSTTVAVVVVSNLPSLLGKLDSPYDGLFPWIVSWRFNLGIFGSQNGLYVALLALAIAAGGVRGLRTYWWMPFAVGMGLSFALEYHSIWFWRFSFAAHAIFGLLCALALEALAGWRRRLVLLAWLGFLLPGIAQNYWSLREYFRAGPFTSKERAEAMDWIGANTPLYARVVEYRVKEGHLVPDTGFLRTGNRAGERPYDRSHPLMGYPDYVKQLSRLEAGVPYNDYIVAEKKSAGAAYVAQCEAPRRFENTRMVVFQIDENCRELLQSPRLRDEFRKRRMRMMREAVTDPARLPLDMFADYMLEHPTEVDRLRQRLDVMWGKGESAAAAKLIEPLLELNPDSAELHYSYAFSLHVSQQGPARAVVHYTKALQLGYAEFWVRYNRGSAWALLKNYREARVDLERARALDPKQKAVQAELEKLPKR